MQLVLALRGVPMYPAEVSRVLQDALITPGGGDPVPAVDFTAFVDHKGCRATHPTVLRRLAGAGAAVASGDAWIHGGDPASLRPLAEAMAEVQAAGLPVLLPARRVDDRWASPALELHATVGFAEVFSERGLVRRAPPGERGEAGPPWSVPALAVAALDDAEPVWNGPDRVQLGDHAASLQAGTAWLRHPAQPAFRRYRYAEVYAGHFDPEHLRDAIVLMGGALGSQGLHRPPVGRWHGMEDSGALISALLTGELVRPLSPWARAAALLLLPLGMLFRPGWRAPRWIALGLLGTAALFALARALFAAGLWWPPTDLALPLLALCAARATTARRLRRAPGLR